MQRWGDHLSVSIFLTYILSLSRLSIIVNVLAPALIIFYKVINQKALANKIHFFPNATYVIIHRALQLIIWDGTRATRKSDGICNTQCEWNSNPNVQDPQTTIYKPRSFYYHRTARRDETSSARMAKQTRVYFPFFSLSPVKHPFARSGTRRAASPGDAIGGKKGDSPSGVALREAIVSSVRPLDRRINYRALAKVNIHKLHAARSDRADDFAATVRADANGAITRRLIRTGTLRSLLTRVTSAGRISGTARPTQLHRFTSFI